MQSAMTMLTQSSFVLTSTSGEKPAIRKRGVKSVNEDIEKKVKAIYADAWRAYDEFRVSHNMAKFNDRIIELKTKYNDDRFLIDVLWAFVPVINTLNARYLMGQEGRIQNDE